jgi:glycosyltransferase involved in cell wall biosynthesis
MLLATPVVSTDCPFGPADLIDPPRTGWLTPVGEIEPLAKAIRHALDHPDEARQRGILAQATIRERLDPGRIVTDYADQLERLARESAQGRSAP